MSEDDEALSQEDVVLRAYLVPGQKLPTADEIRALQQRFGLTHVSTQFVRHQVVQAATFYFAHENPATPNAQDADYRDVIKKTTGLLKSLGDGVENHMIDVEPPGLRRMLYQMRENAERKLTAIQPEVERGRKQRKKTRKGVRNFILNLADMLNRFDVQPKSVYAQNPVTNGYTGEFFELVVEVCSMAGVDLAAQTLGDHIKALHADGTIAFSPRSRAARQGERSEGA